MKKLAYKVLDKYNISTVDEAGIKNMIAGEGYTVIRFSAVGSSDQTERLLTALYLEERASYEDSFTYNDRERRIVFIRKDVSDEEFLYLLSVELGRILTFKTEYDGVIGISAGEDRDAHEFAHHMLDMAEHGIVYNFFKNYTASSITFAVSGIIVLSVLISFFSVRSFMIADFYDYSDENNAILSVDENDTESIPVLLPDTGTSVDDFGITAVSESPLDDEQSNNGEAHDNSVPVEAVDVEEECTSDNAVSIYFSTKSGKKYHLAECGYISGKTVIPVSQKDIENGVYSACSRCIR